MVLSRDTQLFAHHLEGDPYNFVAPLAAMEGASLRNLSTRPWTFRAADGALTQAPPGALVALQNGCRVHFGMCEGEVRLG